MSVTRVILAIAIECLATHRACRTKSQLGRVSRTHAVGKAVPIQRFDL